MLTHTPSLSRQQIQLEKHTAGSHAGEKPGTGIHLEEIGHSNNAFTLLLLLLLLWRQYAVCVLFPETRVTERQ